MAGDWIKMSTDLPTHPKVVRIASALKADRLRVVGGLHAVWCLFDAHSEDGSLDGYSLEALDDLIGWPGFSAAMRDVGWIEESSQALDLPRFENHNGQSAKRRAQETERKRMARAVEELSALDADEKRTREEKRREDKTPPIPRKRGTVHGFPPGFDAFWSAYPRKTAKDAAAKAFAKRKPSQELLAQMLRAIAVQRESEQWRKDGGKFIPHPSKWLNDGRWQDEASGATDELAELFDRGRG